MQFAPSSSIQGEMAVAPGQGQTELRVAEHKLSVGLSLEALVMTAGELPETVLPWALGPDLDWQASGGGMEAGCQFSAVADFAVRLRKIRFLHETSVA
jgi:hypothetical protein